MSRFQSMKVAKTRSWTVEEEEEFICQVNKQYKYVV